MEMDKMQMRHVIHDVRETKSHPHNILLFYPQRNCFHKRFYSMRSISKVRFKDSLKLYEWFVIKGNIVELLGGDSCFLQTIFNCIYREILVMLDSSESFFLSGS